MIFKVNLYLGGENTLKMFQILDIKRILYSGKNTDFFKHTQNVTPNL